jgi:UDP-N-acetylglucosamine--N-acetylmuramyl-(pentapeptide) pyrophosphoryl-undecaprenol N-acetylglucosamine transferase
VGARIVIAGGGTGGHLMPALAIAAALGEVRPDVEPVRVGARRGVEATLLPRRPFRFHLLSAEPLYRRAWWRNVRWLVASWRLIAECRRVLRTEHPAVLVGTGGYAAAPMLLAAAMTGVPIVLQEQNALPGLTTRWFARRARQVYLGFPEAERHLRVGRSTQVLHLGNPIVPPQSAPTRAAARAALGIAPEARVVFVFGGSQGAQRLNSVMAELADRGRLDDLTVCWSTGAGHWNTYGRYAAPPRRLVRPFWDPIAEAYAAADVVVSRAGAMTTAELCAFGLPAVLVPLPSAAADHQTQNAEALRQAGAAVHLPESGLTAEALLAAVRSILEHPETASRMRAQAQARGRPDAARRIAESIAALMS